MRQNIVHLIRLRSHNEDRDFQICKVLLVRQSFIERYKGIESALRQPQKLSVGLPGKACFGNCLATMAAG